MTIAEALDRSNTILRALWNIYAGPLTSVGPRTQPVVAYADLALEHHEAITILVERRLFGSALALVRPIFESTCRAGWVLGCATDDQVEQLRQNDRFQFPSMKAMATEVDGRYRLPDLFTGAVREDWAAMNSFTHSGLRQLTRRFTGGDIEPEYPPEQVVTALTSSLTWVVMLAILVLRTHGREADAERVERLLVPSILT